MKGSKQIMNKVALEQLLSGVAQLETADLERLAEQVNLLLARRKLPNLPQIETELLQKINHGLPEVTQHRFDELRAKLRQGTINSQEHQELLALVDIVEQADAERLQHLIQLSQLRQVSLSDLMHQQMPEVSHQALD
jgi:hypothetical protein